MDLVHCYQELPSVEIDKRAALIQWREYYNSMDRRAVLQYSTITTTAKLLVTKYARNWRSAFWVSIEFISR